MKEQIDVTELNRHQVLQLIQEEVPDINKEVSYRYAYTVSAYNLEDGKLRWKQWSNAVLVALDARHDEATVQAMKGSILDEVYNRIIHPHVRKYEKKETAIVEAYLLVREIAEIWDLNKDEAANLIKFPDKWDKEKWNKEFVMG